MPLSARFIYGRASRGLPFPSWLVNYTLVPRWQSVVPRCLNHSSGGTFLSGSGVTRPAPALCILFSAAESQTSYFGDLDIAASAPVDPPAASAHATCALREPATPVAQPADVPLRLHEVMVLRLRSQLALNRSSIRWSDTVRLPNLRPEYLDSDYSFGPRLCLRVSRARLRLTA